MNFDPMWSVQKNSDLLLVNFVHSLLPILNTLLRFWEIALPVMAIVIPLFLRSDIKRAAHFVQKKMLAKGVQEVCHSAHSGSLGID